VYNGLKYSSKWHLLRGYFPHSQQSSVNYVRKV